MIKVYYNLKDGDSNDGIFMALPGGDCVFSTEYYSDEDLLKNDFTGPNMYWTRCRITSGLYYTPINSPERFEYIGEL
jgi:hypothetical protein